MICTLVTTRRTNGIIASALPVGLIEVDSHANRDPVIPQIALRCTDACGGVATTPASHANRTVAPLFPRGRSFDAASFTAAQRLAIQLAPPGRRHDRDRREVAIGLDLNLDLGAYRFGGLLLEPSPQLRRGVARPRDRRIAVPFVDRALRREERPELLRHERRRPTRAHARSPADRNARRSFPLDIPPAARHVQRPRVCRSKRTARQIEVRARRLATPYRPAHARPPRARGPINHRSRTLAGRRPVIGRCLARRTGGT